MLTFFDCSNGPSRPRHRWAGSPVVNDCVALLKRDAPLFGWRDVGDINAADVLFTNDVWPPYALASKKPLVKRMDGRFWERRYQDRNEAYDEAAKLSDCVIFISQYSLNVSKPVFSPKSHVVIVNRADPKKFFPARLPPLNERKKIISVATDWKRTEKRGESIIRVAQALPQYDFLMVGENSSFLGGGKNVVNHGYESDQNRLAELFRSSDMMLNLSFNDPAPKVVCQGVSCGLNVVYANSGGTSELVACGCAIKDQKQPVGDLPPDIDISEVCRKIDLCLTARRFTMPKQRGYLDYLEMISSYVKVFETCYGGQK